MEFKILSNRDVTSTADCVSEILSPLSIYSEYARKNEINKFSSKNLLEFVNDESRYNLIALDNNSVVGFLFGVVDAHVMFVIWIGMKEDYRRSNHMRTLWETMENWCINHNISRVWCDTNQLNIPSIKFVEKLGYTKCADLTNFWYGHDYFLWEKTL